MYKNPAKLSVRGDKLSVGWGEISVGEDLWTHQKEGVLVANLISERLWASLILTVYTV